MPPKNLRRWRRKLGSLSLSIRRERSEIYQTNPEALDFVMRDTFAFFVGALVDTVGTNAGMAWAVPYELRQRLGEFTPQSIAAMPLEKLEQAMSEPTYLHAYWRSKARFIRQAAEKICSEYDGVTENIWATQFVVEAKTRLRSFTGIGPKLENMITQMLVFHFRVRFHDLPHIDLPYDRHVRRVLIRTGLIHEDSREAVQNIGRVLRPSFPAEFDDALWGVGKKFCTRKSPQHARCPLQTLCQRRFISRTAQFEGDTFKLRK